MNPIPIALALLIGLAALLAAIGARRWLVAKYQRDVHWIRETYLLFDPEPVNAHAYAAMFYLIYFFFLLLMLAVIPSLPVVLIIWVASWWAPRVIASWLWRRRLERLDAQIPQAVSSLANSMRAGLTLVQSITRLAEQAPEPIRVEFKIMANQYGYGADMETVIRNAKTRLNLPNFSLFASALILNREMGGDISETLTRISKSLDKLREMKKNVEAHTSEGRANIKVLIFAPFIMLGTMALAMPDRIGLLFSTSQGWAILFVAALLAGSGIYFASRITRSEV